MNHKWLLASHLDFHNPDNIPVGERFDAAEFVGQLSRGGVDVIYSFAKCHYGNSYYPTRVGRTHPLLKRDLLGEAVIACHQAGIGIIGYMSGFVDAYLTRTRPDWRHLNADGSQTLFVDAFDAVCPFGPYVDESLIPQLVEIATAYPLDGLFVDTMSLFEPCYCSHCAERFRRETGLALPRTALEPGWNDWGRLRHRWANDMRQRMAAAVHSARADLKFGMNYAFIACEPTEPVPGLDYFTADVDQRDYQALALGYQARYLATLGHPFEVMTGRFCHGLTDWSVRSPTALMQQAAVVTALGGRFAVIDRELPDGTLDPAHYGGMAEVSAFLRQRVSVFTDTEPAPGGTLILHGADASLGPDAVEFGTNDPLLGRQKPVIGAYRALADWSEEVLIVGQHRLPQFLPSAAALILPEQRHISQAAVPGLKQFLQRGGLIIASHPLGLSAEWMKELFGVTHEGKDLWDYGYLDSGDGEPLLVRGKWGVYRLDGAQELGRLRHPVGEPGQHYIFAGGVFPPCREAAALGVTIRRHGDGAAVLFAGPIFGSHHSHYDPAIPLLVRKLLRNWAKTAVKIQAPPQVQVVLRRKANRLLVHLINTNGERLIGGWPAFDGLRPATDVQVMLRCPKPRSVIAQPGAEPVDFKYEEGILTTGLPRLEIHRCLEVVP